VTSFRANDGSLNLVQTCNLAYSGRCYKRPTLQKTNAYKRPTRRFYKRPTPTKDQLYKRPTPTKKS